MVVIFSQHFNDAIPCILALLVFVNKSAIVLLLILWRWWCFPLILHLRNSLWLWFLKVLVCCSLVCFSLYLSSLVFLAILQSKDRCLFQLRRLSNHYFLKYCFSLYSLSPFMLWLNLHALKDLFNMVEISLISYS